MILTPSIMLWTKVITDEITMHHDMTILNDIILLDGMLISPNSTERGIQKEWTMPTTIARADNAAIRDTSLTISAERLTLPLTICATAVARTASTAPWAVSNTVPASVIRLSRSSSM